MKKLSVVLIAVMFFAASCITHTHVIGSGGTGGSSEIKRQMYILALVPINVVDTKAMAGGATDYTIETTSTVVDVIISGIVPLLNTRTVTVTK